MAVAYKKRKCFSMEAKKLLIEEVETGARSKAQICRDYQIPSSTLSTILKAKNSITEALATGNYQSGRKKRTLPTYFAVDRALYKWYLTVKNKQTITGPIVIKKGEEMAKKFGFKGFKMSTGWLDRFKNRHGISFKKGQKKEGTHTAREELAQGDIITEQSNEILRNIRDEIVKLEQTDSDYEIFNSISSECNSGNGSSRLNHTNVTTNPRFKERKQANPITSTRGRTNRDITCISGPQQGNSLVSSTAEIGGGEEAPLILKMENDLMTVEIDCDNGANYSTENIPFTTTAEMSLNTGSLSHPAPTNKDYDEGSSIIKDLTKSTAQQTIKQLRKFILQQPDNSIALAQLSGVADFVRSLPSHQPKINSYFKPIRKSVVMGKHVRQKVVSPN